MPVSDSSKYNCQLAELAELMDESSWQQDELARIKTTWGYRLCNLIYGAADKMFCSNLFSYIGDKFKQPSKSPIERRLRKGYTLSQQMNARTFGRERKFTEIIFFSRLLLVYCCCCCVGLTMSTINQYKYDYYAYHLNHFRSGQLDDGRTIYEQVNVTEEQLLRKLQEAKAGAKVFGSFLLNRSFFAQSCYILMTILCIFTYPGPLLYFRLIGPFDFHYLRMLLNWDQEQRNCNRMIVDLIETLCFSSERFMEISLEDQQARILGFSFKKESNSMIKLFDAQSELNKSDGNFADRSMFVPVFRSVVGATRPRRDQISSVSAKLTYVDEHGWLERRLKVLALTGRLQPLDRCDVREMSEANIFYAFFAISGVQSCFLWNIILFGTLLPNFGFNYELDFMDCVSFVELGSLNVLLTISGMYYISMALVYCREQARVVYKLRSMISGFIAKHRRALELADCDQLQPAQTENLNGILGNYYDVLNTDFLLIIMHYKIFATQSGPAQRSFGLVLLSCAGLMTIFPIIARLHLPYLRHIESKVLSIVVCLIMIGLPDFATVPMCWMHSRCLNLCHDMWKLMAFIVNIADHSRLGTSLNEHSVWLLRKELSSPEQQHGQFAIVTFGLKFTYGKLLKLHFWLGFLILSFIIELKSSPADSSAPNTGYQLAGSESMMLGGWLSDPLGINWKFKL